TEGVIKTREMAKVLKALKLGDQTCLIGTVTPDAGGQEGHGKLYRAARNIEGVKMLPVAEFNAYTGLRQKRLGPTRRTREAARKGRRSGKKAEAQAHNHSEIRGTGHGQPSRYPAGARAEAGAAPDHRPPADHGEGHAPIDAPPGVPLPGQPLGDQGGDQGGL